MVASPPIQLFKMSKGRSLSGLFCPCFILWFKYTPYFNVCLLAQCTKYTLYFCVYYTLYFNACFIYYNVGMVIFLIKYKIDIIQALKNKGYSTYKIRKEKIFNESQLQQMRENRILAQEAFNKLCALLDCQPGDILEYIPDVQETKTGI